ncbi:CaiB/BaiF CoA-transferase family protein [Sporomusa sp. KB1]|jgi:crotonobetainyl-CoA:carnitine CoA-transferase CaiB-like acyl-CoA transferase|uniref:CaiB/BaiF CoA transferase family protein n=1 Tax=Sporomusa sp. KB1 TaxID=943346 RepID=UPI0011A781F0|nr:CaiB/BaiF CoA-transferase family protein [Sporomusa sp. KB1]TWH46740.1 formyl-CoA transferase/CoA:oxalate CoA-transferase [Sporomusa sp. KB1]
MRNIFDGIKVIDFTSTAAGPTATALLADFGAEVIKVERPKVGDDSRQFMPQFEGNSMTHMWCNRGKKSLVVDMQDPIGVEIVEKLILQADIVVESFRPGTMAKFGFDYDNLKKINPRIIMCSVSGYGQTGPDSHKPGYDIVAQALSGAMDLTGDPDGPPVRSGLVLADYCAGYNAFAGMVAALYYRERTGKGQHVDIALLDCLIGMNSFVEAAGLGHKPTRTGNHHGMLAPFGVFKGKSEYAIICAPNLKLWSLLCTVMGRTDFIEDPLFNTSPNRIKNIDKMITEIEQWLKTFDKIDEPVAMMDKAGIPCAKILTSNDVISNEHLKVREMIIELETPSGKKISARGNHLKFSEAKAILRKAPKLGEHEDQILKLIGYDDVKIAELKSKWGC